MEPPVRVHTFALLAALVASPTLAQSDLSAATPNELAKGCTEALENGQSAKPFVEELLNRADVPLGSTWGFEAVLCINKVTGEKYFYENRQFVTDSILKELEQKERDAAQRAKSLQIEREAQAEQRELAYIGAVVQACLKEYKDDRFRALTTPLCGEVFKAQGLPE